MDKEKTSGYYAGIDLGSCFVKAVLMNEKTVVSSHISPMIGRHESIAEEVLKEVLAKVGLSVEALDWVTITGYGKYNLPFPHRKVSPLSANAKGINFLFPQVRTVIDMGMQQSSVVRLNAQGDVLDNVITEKCAAGSGWLLKVVARVMGINLEDLGPLSLNARKVVDITTDCAVFAETEVISRISEGTPKEDILAGVHKALALTISSLVQRVGLEEECALIGGGGKNIGFVKRLVETLGVDIKIPEEPQFTTACGAILFHRS